MWPADIEALQAKLNDVPSGGRPFFYMEVIDQGIILKRGWELSFRFSEIFGSKTYFLLEFPDYFCIHKEISLLKSFGLFHFWPQLKISVN